LGSPGSLFPGAEGGGAFRPLPRILGGPGSERIRLPVPRGGRGNLPASLLERDAFYLPGALDLRERSGPTLTQSTKSQDMEAGEFVKESTQFQTPLSCHAALQARAIWGSLAFSCLQLLRNPNRFLSDEFSDRANGVVMRFRRGDPPGSILEGRGIPWGRREEEGPSWAFYRVLGPVDRLARLCWGIQLDSGCHAYTIDRRAGVCSWHRCHFSSYVNACSCTAKRPQGPPRGGGGI